MTNELDLTQLRAVAEAATPGPWESYDRGIGYEVYQSGSDWCLNSGQRETFSKSDATHIATFDPITVLALLSRIEQAEQAVARVREVIRQYDPDHLTCMCNSDGDCCKCTVADFQEALDGEQDG